MAGLFDKLVVVGLGCFLLVYGCVCVGVDL